ncbi:hypothetical protein CHS0354_042824 [Potamilus streckersoni]|uniref:Uncharacterized protein n=1 Tax=Potamilus streckersoni TaxID=2493646 RepID=A0AAE0T581_9BIVA|nr:hypothetical protein CHS0354_042824 [Potamilus streckersoni]
MDLDPALARNALRGLGIKMSTGWILVRWEKETTDQVDNRESRIRRQDYDDNRNRHIQEDGINMDETCQRDPYPYRLYSGLNIKQLGQASLYHRNYRNHKKKIEARKNDQPTPPPPSSLPPSSP